MIENMNGGCNMNSIAIAVLKYMKSFPKGKLTQERLSENLGKSKRKTRKDIDTLNQSTEDMTYVIYDKTKGHKTIEKIEEVEQERGKLAKMYNRLNNKRNKLNHIEYALRNKE